MRNLGCKPPRRATVTSTRMDVTCGSGIITGLAVYAPAWTDTTTPRTDAPVRFAWERCCNLPSCGVTHRRLHSAIAPHFR